LLTVAANVLADLKIEEAAVESERRTVEADLGPAQHLATQLGQADEMVLRWFILIVALLLDPAAVLLFLAVDADTVLSANAQDGVQGGRRARQVRRDKEGAAGRPEKRMGGLPSRDLRLLVTEVDHAATNSKGQVR
jgi:hypothetical protein